MAKTEPNLETRNVNNKMEDVALYLELTLEPYPKLDWD